jgi:chorismate mutase
VDKALYEQKVNELKELEIMVAAMDSEILLLQKKKAEFSQKIAELKHQRVSHQNEQERFLRPGY